MTLSDAPQFFSSAGAVPPHTSWKTSEILPVFRLFECRVWPYRALLNPLKLLKFSLSNKAQSPTENKWEGLKYLSIGKFGWGISLLIPLPHFKRKFQINTLWIEWGNGKGYQPLKPQILLTSFLILLIYDINIPNSTEGCIPLQLIRGL